MACVILQRQIEVIKGRRENIICPSVAMREIMQSLSRESDDPSTLQRTATVSEPGDLENTSESRNFCLQCRTNDLQLACLPCGHLVTCIPCRGSLTSCPICRSKIKAFVRIYQ